MFRVALLGSIEVSPSPEPERGVSITEVEVDGARLFRDAEPTPASQRSSSIVLALAVPGHCRAHESLMGSISAEDSPGVGTLSPLMEKATYIRRRGADPSEASMAIFKLSGLEEAEDFFQRHHGTWIGAESDRPAVCLKLVFLSAVEHFDQEEQSKSSSGVVPIDLALPPSEPAAAVELPSCAVCVDRLDPGVSFIGPGVCSHQAMIAELSDGPSGICSCWAVLSMSNCKVCTTLRKSAQPAAVGVTVEATIRNGVESSACTGAAVGRAGGPSETTSGGTPVCPEARSSVECEVCAHREKLWTCLVCGFVGCGRYTSSHSLKHYYASGHRWALDLVSRRIWDYYEDAYAHRLPGSGTGRQGRLGGAGETYGGGSGGGSGGGGGVGGGGSHRGLRGDAGEHMDKAADASAKAGGGWSAGDYGGSDAPAVKVGGLAREYELLLMAALGEQRRHFEQLLAKEEAAAIEEAAEGQASPEELEAAATLRERCRALEADLHAERRSAEALDAALRAGKAAQAALLKKSREAERRTRGLKGQAREHQQASEEAVAELQAQLDELTCHQRTQSEVDQSPNKEEIRNGQVLLAEGPNGQKKQQSRRSGGRRGHG